MRYSLPRSRASGNVLPFPIHDNVSQAPVVVTAQLLRKNPYAAYFALSALPCSTVTLASEFIKGTPLDNPDNRAVVIKFLARCSIYDPAGMSNAQRDVQLVVMRSADRAKIAEAILPSMKEMLAETHAGQGA